MRLEYRNSEDEPDNIIRDLIKKQEDWNIGVQRMRRSANNSTALEIQRIKLEVISKSYSKTMRIEYRCSEDEESAIIL